METQIQTVVQSESAPLVQEARELKIMCQDDRNLALEMIKKVRRTWKAIDEKLGLTKAKEAAHEAKVATLNTYNNAKEQFEQAETILNSNIRNFDLAEKRRRDNEAKLIEAKRLETERIAKEKLQAEAQKQEKKGNVEVAESLRNQAETLIAPPAFQMPEAAPVEGTTSKVIWKAKVINVHDVCRLIADGVLPSALVSFNQAELNRLAGQWGGQTTFKGIEFFEDARLTVRS